MCNIIRLYGLYTRRAPVPTRTISLAIRRDYIHEARLNAVVDAVKRIIPGTLLENVVRKERLVL